MEYLIILWHSETINKVIIESGGGVSWSEIALEILEDPGYYEQAQEGIGRGLKRFTGLFDLGSIKKDS